MKNAMKKWLSLLLTVLMVVAAMPFAALAEGDLIEEVLVPVETETPAEPVVNVSNAVAAVSLLAAGEEAAETEPAYLEQIAALQAEAEALDPESETLQAECHDIYTRLMAVYEPAAAEYHAGTMTEEDYNAIYNAVGAVVGILNGYGYDPYAVEQPTITGTATVQVYGTVQLTSNLGNSTKSRHAWSSGDESIAVIGEVSSNGKTAAIRGVKEGTVTIIHQYDDGSGNIQRDTFALTVEGEKSISTKQAQIYYLESPDYDPNSNDTDMWGEQVGSNAGTVYMDGANWVNGDVIWGYQITNVFDPLPYIVSMGGGLEDQGNGSWLMPKGQFAKHYIAILATYNERLKADLNLSENLTIDQIEAIYLIPYKISSNYDGYHIDCRINVKTTGFFTVNFWVETIDDKVVLAEKPWNFVKPNDIQTIQIPVTQKAGIAGTAYPPTIESGGITYVFVGWKNEAGELISNNGWPYTPNEAELEDGAVEFFAYYEPAEEEITVTKIVENGSAADNSKKFSFTYSVNDGETTNTFALAHNETIKLNVPGNAKVVVTETLDDQYTVTNAVDTGEAMSGNVATIDNVAGASHSIVFTNTPATTTVTATKVWVDNSNANGIRPESVDLTLSVDGEAVKDVTPVISKADNTWTYTWDGVPVGDTYTVDESTVPAGYTSSVNEMIVTNTLATTNVSVTKAWSDNDNAYGTRPESITVNLTANGAVVANQLATIEPAADGTWSHTWQSLPTHALVMAADGSSSVEPIEYGVVESDVPGYTATITGDATNGFTVTNTLKEHALTVQKTVSGNMGDQAKEFAFVTTIARKENNADLHHSETVSYTVPYGAAVAVTENPDGYTYSLVSATYMDAESKDVSLTKTDETNGISFTMPDGDVTVVINNDKTAEVDTGILLDSLPYVLILAVVGAALVLWFVRKRRTDD